MSAFNPEPKDVRTSGMVNHGPGFQGPLPSPDTLCARDCGREWYIMRRNVKGVWEPVCGSCFVRLAQAGSLSLENAVPVRRSGTQSPLGTGPQLSDHGVPA